MLLSHGCVLGFSLGLEDGDFGIFKILLLFLLPVSDIYAYVGVELHFSLLPIFEPSDVNVLCIEHTGLVVRPPPIPPKKSRSFRNSPRSPSPRSPRSLSASSSPRSTDGRSPPVPPPKVPKSLSSRTPKVKRSKTSMIRRQNCVSASDVQLPSVPSVPEGTKESSKEQMYAWQLTIYELVANRDIDLLKSTLQAIKESGYSLAPILNTPHGPRHARDEVSTALHQAAFYGYLDCVEVLVKEGAVSVFYVFYANIGILVLGIVKGHQYLFTLRSIECGHFAAINMPAHV